MAGTKGRYKNPLLEKIREEVPELPNIDEIIKTLTSPPKIHAAYLYYSEEGYEFLQKLCLLLSGTKSTYRYAGWEDFGIKLGLDPLLLQNIKHSLQKEDPTTYILLAYVQKSDATIENIIYSLREIKRYDVILETESLIRKVCEKILLQHKIDSNEIIRPKAAPDCPFVCKNLTKYQNTYKDYPIISENQQNAAPIKVQRKNKQVYAKTILLTYSCDADKIVEELLIKLRQPRQNLKLGIVILNEHHLKLNSCPEQFIFDCFTQVNYIFPIITPQYIKQITSNIENYYFSATENSDHKYVKYIYRLLSTHYIKHGCNNYKVRCIIPNEFTKTILKHPIMNLSVFQSWVRISEVEELIEAILSHY